MTLSDDQIDGAFNLFTDGSGQYIDGESLKTILSSFGLRAPYDDYSNLDEYGRRNPVSRDEFHYIVRNQASEVSAGREVLQAFQAFDIGAKGEILPEDLMAVAHSLSEYPSESEIDELWRCLGANDMSYDGKPQLTFKAWKTALCQVSHKFNLPISEYDAEWYDLQSEEYQTRESRRIEEERRIDLARLRRERADEAAERLSEHRKTFAIETAYAEPKWRQRKEEERIYHEKSEKRRALLAAQQEARRLELESEREEYERVLRRREERKLALETSRGGVQTVVQTTTTTEFDTQNHADPYGESITDNTISGDI